MSHHYKIGMQAEKPELSSVIHAFEDIVKTRTRNEATSALYNAFNAAKIDMINRLMQCLWNAENELAKNTCAQLSQNGVQSETTGECLRRAATKLRSRRAYPLKATNKVAADLLETDFLVLEMNLRNARSLTDQERVALQLPDTLQDLPIISLLLALDPDKLMLNLPKYLSKQQFQNILKPALSPEIDSFSKLKANFIAFQQASPRPTAEKVEAALSDLQSDELRTLFREIAHTDYALHDTVVKGGGKIVNVAFRWVRMVWSKLVVWIVILIVDLLDLLNTSIHFIIFKPLSDCTRLLAETSRPDLIRQSNSVEALSKKIRGITSQALAKFGYRISVNVLAAEPNYAHRVFQGAFTTPESPKRLLPSRKDNAGLGIGNEVLFIPSLRKKWREYCEECIQISVNDNLLPTEKDQRQPCSKVSVFVAGKIESYSHVIIFSHHRGEELWGSTYSYIKLSRFFNMPIVAYDYCGYGNSTGEANEDNCYKSALAVFNWTCKRYNVVPMRIFSVGFSMGAAVSAYLAYKKEGLAGVVLVSGFTSLTEIIKVDIPGLNMFPTKQIIHKIKCPMLLIHGRADSLIPYQHSERLYALAQRYNKKADAQIEIIDNMDHDYTQTAYDITRAFLNRHT